MERLRFKGPGKAPRFPGVTVVKIDNDTVETDNPEALIASGKFEKISGGGTSKKKSKKSGVDEDSDGGDN